MLDSSSFTLKDGLTLVVSFLAFLIAFLTLLKGILEFRRATIMKRLELFLTLRSRLREDKEFIEICELLVNDDLKLRDIPLVQKDRFTGFFEELAIIRNSKVITDDVVLYMFSYFAIQCSDSKNYWFGLNKKEVFWSLFFEFASAKAIAVLAVHGGPMRRFKAPFQLNEPGLPIIAIPTTAGTGSEATRFTIVTDDASGEKMLCIGYAYLPTAAIVDYELTLEKPKRLTADTGADSLTHAIEAYVSRRANPFADSFSRTAMEAIWRSLPVAYFEPKNRTARESMMLAATQAGIAFSNSSVALVHGMSRPIGARFHVPHGMSNAMLLPAITTFSLPGSLSRYAGCARIMGIAKSEVNDESAAAALVEALRPLNLQLEVPTPAKLGIDRKQWFDAIPTMVEQAIASGSPANNPRVPTAQEISDLYNEVYG